MTVVSNYQLSKIFKIDIRSSDIILCNSNQNTAIFTCVFVDVFVNSSTNVGY